MIRSLNNGRAGLTSYQQGIDVIANNIANINTTGYKTKSVVFSDMLSHFGGNSFFVSARLDLL